MQDFNNYDYKITIDQLKAISDIVNNITVIINGEYYDLISDSGNNLDEKGVIL